MRIKVECPNCHGDGITIDFIDDARNHNYKTCDFCQGDGYKMYDVEDERGEE